VRKQTKIRLQKANSLQCLNSEYDNGVRLRPNEEQNLMSTVTELT